MHYMNALKHFGARTLRRSSFAMKLRNRLLPPTPIQFVSSELYWKERYARGGNSGEGSYGPLADYKASFIKSFCAKRGVNTAIEFGCGDGNQALKLNFDRYIGVDISDKCIQWARQSIKRPGWEFFTTKEFSEISGREVCDLGLSLDVVYHLVEDEVYDAYISDLFSTASKFVLIYSSNSEYFDPRFPHVRHRPVVADIRASQSNWQYVGSELNPYHQDPGARPSYGSFAQFHIFEKRV